MTDPRYPIGQFVSPAEFSPAVREQLIAEVAAAPTAMRRAVDGLTAAQLDTPYRPGGWTVRQVVHHVPDSHLHAYVRFKLALTEDEPTIKPYAEQLWAELPDTAATPVDASLRILDGVHARWTSLMRAMSDADFRRGYYHPEHARVVTLDEALAQYAWHGKHHVAHITALRQRSGW